MLAHSFQLLRKPERSTSADYLLALIYVSVDNPEPVRHAGKRKPLTTCAYQLSCCSCLLLILSYLLTFAQSAPVVDSPRPSA